MIKKLPHGWGCVARCDVTGCGNVIGFGVTNTKRALEGVTRGSHAWIAATGRLAGRGKPSKAAKHQLLACPSCGSRGADELLAEINAERAEIEAEIAAARAKARAEKKAAKAKARRKRKS